MVAVAVVPAPTTSPGVRRRSSTRQKSGSTPSVRRCRRVASARHGREHALARADSGRGSCRRGLCAHPARDRVERRVRLGHPEDAHRGRGSPGRARSARARRCARPSSARSPSAARGGGARGDRQAVAARVTPPATRPTSGGGGIWTSSSRPLPEALEPVGQPSARAPGVPLLPPPGRRCAARRAAAGGEPLEVSEPAQAVLDLVRVLVVVARRRQSTGRHRRTRARSSSSSGRALGEDAALEVGRDRLAEQVEDRRGDVLDARRTARAPGPRTARRARRSPPWRWLPT